MLHPRFIHRRMGLRERTTVGSNFTRLRVAHPLLGKVTGIRELENVARLPNDFASRIHAVAAAAGRAGDVKRLAGSNLFRLRVGDYRVLFALDPASQVRR